MADTQEQSLGTITPVDGDYFRVVDDPEGSPASRNVSGTALKAYLKAYNDTLYNGIANITFCSADFTATSNTTLADITGLSTTVESGGKYHFKVYLMINSTANGGVKTAVSGTATATAIRFINSVFTSSGVAVSHSTALDSASGSTVAVLYKVIEGYIEVNAGGSFKIQFAQNASHGDTSTVYTGSWMTVDKIG